MVDTLARSQRRRKLTLTADSSLLKSQLPWPGALPPYGQTTDTFSASSQVVDLLLRARRR